MELPRVPETGDLARTFNPPKRLVLARACVESLRVIPWLIMGALGVGMLYAFELIRTAWGWGVVTAAAGLVMLAAGLVAALVTTLAKWLLVGRFTEDTHPLWSSLSGATSSSTSSTRSWECRGSAARSSARRCSTPGPARSGPRSARA